MGPVAGNLSSSKVLKNTRWASMSLGPRSGTHSGVIFGKPPISRSQQTLEKQMRAPVCVPCVLNRHVGGTLHWARLRGKAEE